MDALERENRLWQARAAVGQDLDRLTARLVTLAMSAASDDRARLAAANVTSRFLVALVNRVAESDVRVEDVATLFRPHPFTESFECGADAPGARVALARLRDLTLITDDEVARYQQEIRRAVP